MLLLPLGLEPQWVVRSDLSDGGIYYGMHLAELPEKVLSIALHPETLAYFLERTVYEAGSVTWVTWENESWPVLFGGETPEEPDVIASTFFWLSGWQEYTTPARDRYGRFSHADSLQAAFDTTTRPCVDAYRGMLADWLKSYGVPIQRRQWGGASWALCPTHDIDYLKKWRKGMIYREVVEYLLQNRRQEKMGERINRFGQFLKDWMRTGDLYRTAFVRMQSEVEQRDGTATYFLKAGAHGLYDVHYPLDDAFLQERIASLKEGGFEIGLHPSFYAHTHAFYLEEERGRLHANTAQEPVSVRQHYLRYMIPTTPRLHQDAGFLIDSSLGFPEIEGFRHATCLPFQIFDPVSNGPLDVWEIPLSIMESALFNRRGLSSAQAHTATKDILQTCKRFGGVAVVLWHNVLWDELDFQGWGTHFSHTLDVAVEDGARIVSLREAMASWEA